MGARLLSALTMQNPENSLLPPPNHLGQPYLHVEEQQEQGRPAGFRSSEEVEAFMNQAAAQNRQFDLEPVPGEVHPWRPDQPGMYQTSFVLPMMLFPDSSVRTVLYLSFSRVARLIVNCSFEVPFRICRRLFSTSG
jgi:hypothetical protein